MSTATPYSPPPLLTITGHYRFTPDTYHTLRGQEDFQDCEPFELLEGYLVLTKSRHPTRIAGVCRIANRTQMHLPVGWYLHVQLPVSLGMSAPEPDVGIVRRDERLPNAADFGIVIEVSDSSLDFDRRDKGRIYARAGIPVYWIVNVVDRQIEVYTNPDPAANPPEYTASAIYLPGQSVPLMLDGIAVGAIPVSEFIA